MERRVSLLKNWYGIGSLLIALLYNGNVWGQGDAELWSRLDNSRQLTHIKNPAISRWEREWHQRAAELRVIFEAQGQWLYPILDMVAERDLPGELALVPIIESKLRPDARSSRDAVGMWQMRPATADYLGLQIDIWSDDRLNPLAAASAALDYLEQLHRRFGSWPLALAAYNAGQGRVSRAIQKARSKNQSTDYWALPLPAESRDYVPKLLGLARALADIEGMGLPWVNPATAPVRVNVGGPASVEDIAKATGLSIDTIYRYNPNIKLWAVPPRAPWQILIPASAWPRAQEKLAAIPPEKRTRWETVTVRSGDSLGVIADRWGTKVSLVKRVNGLRSDRIFVGQQLRIPAGSQSLSSTIVAAAARERRVAPTKPPTSPTEWHRVQRGETLWSVSRRYHLSVANLRLWNNLEASDPLHPGQQLRIAPPPGRAPVMHALASDDSLQAIADRYGVSVAELRSWNRLGSAHLGNQRELLVFAPR